MINVEGIVWTHVLSSNLLCNGEVNNQDKIHCLMTINVCGTITELIKMVKLFQTKVLKSVWKHTYLSSFSFLLIFLSSASFRDISRATASSLRTAIRCFRWNLVLRYARASSQVLAAVTSTNQAREVLNSREWTLQNSPKSNRRVT